MEWREIDGRVLLAASKLAYVNPFDQERLALEAEVFGLLELPRPPAPSSEEDIRQPRGDHPSFEELDRRLEEILKRLACQDGLPNRSFAGKDAFKLAADTARYLLYRRHRHTFDKLLLEEGENRENRSSAWRAESWKRFLDDYRRFRPPLGRQFGYVNPMHLYACFFQIRRAVSHIWHYIIGRARPVADLRAAVWESIFTVDINSFLASLYPCLGRSPTLIVGPTGTGKELVARAIGLSRHCSFDKGTRTFPDYSPDAIHALSLAAVPETLVESQIFGHQKGAFTDAIQDHDGVLKRCGPAETVFLDEIGDVPVGTQVKLLRVLQTRRFLPIGATQEEAFEGKIITATNRNLAKQIESGDFRQDLYFRLCGDIVVTPTLHEQLSDCPEDLPALVHFIIRRELGKCVSEDAAKSLANHISTWIGENLGDDYHWPGNTRELEQCVRNVLVHGRYCPMPRFADSALEDFAERVTSCSLSLDQLKTYYCTLGYALTGDYVKTGQRLHIDRRTVRDRIDPALLARFRSALGK